MMPLLLASIASLVIPVQAKAVDQRPTYIVRMKDGTGPYYGYVADDNADPVVIEFDSGPDKGQKKFLSREKIALPIEQETRTARADRLRKAEEKEQEALEKSGYMRVNARLLKPKVEVELSNRAKAMVAEREDRHRAMAERSGARAPVQRSNAGDEDVKAAAGPSFFKQWGGQIIIGIVGLVLCGIIVKTMLL